eukprot:1396052-Prymnesium_polylepis.1
MMRGSVLPVGVSPRGEARRERRVQLRRVQLIQGKERRRAVDSRGGARTRRVRAWRACGPCARAGLAKQAQRPTLKSRSAAS